MSRGYQVQWVSVQSRVQHDDRLELEVGLMGILSEAEMRALLREELERDGWAREASGAMGKTVQGIEVKLSPDGSKITATTSTDSEVVAGGYDKAAAQSSLARAEDVEKARLGARSAKTLSEVEATLRPEIDAAVQRVYVAALKQKAASLGQVESVVESRGEGGDIEVTIKIRT